MIKRRAATAQRPQGIWYGALPHTRPLGKLELGAFSELEIFEIEIELELEPNNAARVQSVVGVSKVDVDPLVKVYGVTVVHRDTNSSSPEILWTR